MRKTTIAAIALTSATILSGGGLFAANAANASVAGVHPTESPTIQPPIVTPTPTPAPSEPEINPLDACQFTFTDEVTYVPELHRFVNLGDPSITCVRHRHVFVYLLQRS